MNTQTLLRKSHHGQSVKLIDRGNIIVYKLCANVQNLGQTAQVALIGLHHI